MAAPAMKWSQSVAASSQQVHVTGVALDEVVIGVVVVATCATGPYFE